MDAKRPQTSLTRSLTARPVPSGRRTAPSGLGSFRGGSAPSSRLIWSRTTARAVAFAIWAVMCQCVCVTDARLHGGGLRQLTPSVQKKTQLNLDTREYVRYTATATSLFGMLGAARAAAAWQRVGTRRGRRLPSSLPPAATAKPARWFSGLFLFPCCSCLLQSCSSPPLLGDPWFVLSCVGHSVYFYCKFQRFMRP